MNHFVLDRRPSQPRRLPPRRRSRPTHLPLAPLPLLLLRADNRLAPVIAQLELRIARKAHRVGGRLAENTETDTADEAHVHDLPVAEASRAEVDAGLRRRHEIPPARRAGQERLQQRLQQALRLRERDVAA